MSVDEKWPNPHSGAETEAKFGLSMSNNPHNCNNLFFALID